MARLVNKVRRRRPTLNHGEILDALAAFRDLTGDALVVHVSRSVTVVAYDACQFDRLVELLEDDGDTEPSIPAYDRIPLPGAILWVDQGEREDDAGDGGEVEASEPNLASTALEDRTGRYAGGDHFVDAELDPSESEPSLGAAEPFQVGRLLPDQSDWAASGRGDREADAGDEREVETSV